MTKLVAQSVINSFFDGKHADPFAVLGMHETHNGIEVRALLPDADKVEVIDKESQSIVVVLEKVDDRGFFYCDCAGDSSFLGLPIKSVLGGRSPNY